MTTRRTWSRRARNARIRLTTLLSVLLLAAAAGVLLTWYRRIPEHPLPPPRDPDTVRGTRREPDVVPWSFAPPPAPARPAAIAAPPVVADGDKPPPVARRPDAIAGEYVLSFYDDKDREAFLALARSLGVTVLDMLALGNSVRIRASDAALKSLLEKGPAAVAFDANYTIRYPPPPPIDPRQPEGGYKPFRDGALRWLGVGGDTSGWGRGVTVAVLDTGVNSHAALEGVRVTRLDLLGDGAGTDPSTKSAHGTAVASLIAGRADAVRGVAPSVDILSIRVIGDNGEGDTFTAARGIVEAVDRGADVINLSIGTRGDSFILQQAVAYATANGVAVVASTGNDASLGVLYPAAYPEVVAVSAVDANGRHLYFSNRGEAVDVAAPGIAVNAAWTGSDLLLFSGTSAAAPLVSGAVAALMSWEPELTAAEAAAIVQQYSNDGGAPGPDVEFGEGSINLRRVAERDQGGIYDMAVALPYVHRGEGDGDMVVSVYAQNRGTEPVGTVRMSVTINDAKYSMVYQDVAVGETVSHRFRVPQAELAFEGAATINTVVSLDGAEDTYPENNARETTIMRVE